MPAKTEIAWAAGFFDGEGTTCLQKQTKSGRDYPRIAITQKFPEVLHRFRAAVNIGKVYGPYRHAAPYQFVATCHDAVIALRVIWPYLSPIKKAQAERIMREVGWEMVEREAS